MNNETETEVDLFGFLDYLYAIEQNNPTPEKPLMVPVPQASTQKFITINGQNYEASAIVKALEIPYHDSELAGATIYHGTTDFNITSVSAGIENRGEHAIAGKGLYAAVHNKELAQEYAFIAKSKTPSGCISKSVLIEGYLNPKANLRIGKIELAPRYPICQPNFLKGIFPPKWSKHSELQTLIHEHFDALLVVNADKAGYNIASDKFLVIHASANPEVKWTKAHIINDQNTILSTKDLIKENQSSVTTTPSNNTMVKRPAISKGPKLPLHQRIPYKTAFNGLIKGFGTILALWEAYNSFEQELINYPDYSTAAHILAVTTQLAIDNCALALPGLAPFIITVNILAELANLIRDIPREPLIQNREILDQTLIILDIAPEAAEFILKDFDHGGNLGQQFLHATFDALKPLEAYYDFKQAPANLVREAVNNLTRPIGQLKTDKGSEIWQDKTLQVKAFQALKESLSQRINSGLFTESIARISAENTLSPAKQLTEETMPAFANPNNTDKPSLNEVNNLPTQATESINDQQPSTLKKEHVLAALSKGQADIEGNLEKIAQASALTEQLSDYLANQKVTINKKEELARFISASTALANCILQLTHQTPEAKAFNANKQHILQQAKSHFLDMGLQVDIEKLYTTHLNKHSNYPQILEHVNQTLADTPCSISNFKLALIQKKEAFNEISGRLNQLKTQLSHLEERQRNLSQLDVSITQDFNHILKKIDKIKYDQTYSKLASLTQLTATVAALFGEPVTASIAQAATLALNFFDQQVNQKKSKTINSLQKTADRFSAVHQNVAMKNQAIANIINTNQEQVHYFEQVQMQLQSPKKYRESLAERINAIPGEIKNKTGQIETLKTEITPLKEKIETREGIDNSYKTNRDHKGNSKADCPKAQENRAELARLKEELDSKEALITSTEIEITHLENENDTKQKELAKQNTVKYISDYIFEQQEKELYADCQDDDPQKPENKRKQKEEQIKKQAEIHDAIVKLDNQITDKERSFAAYHNLLDNTAQANATLARYAELMSFKDTAWYLNKASHTAHSIQFAHQTYLKGEQLVTKFSDGLTQILNELNNEDQSLPIIPLLPTILPFLANPLFSVIQIGDQLIQSVANLLFGIELFPNPTLEQLTQLSKQVEKLSKQLHQAQRETQSMLLKMDNQISRLLDKQDFTNDQLNVTHDLLKQVLDNLSEEKQDNLNNLIRSKINRIEPLFTKTTYKLEHLEQLLQYVKDTTRLEYSTCPKLLKSAYSPFNLINSIAAGVDSQFNPLPNYYLLNIALEIFNKRREKLTALNQHPFYNDLQQTLTQNLTQLITFLDNLRDDPSWLIKLSMAIKVEIAGMLKIINEQNQGQTILDEIQQSEKDLLQTTKSDYFLSRKTVWENRFSPKLNELKYAAPTYKGSDSDNYTFKPAIEIRKTGCTETLFSQVFYPNSLEAKRYSIPSLNESFLQLNAHISQGYKAGYLHSTADILSSISKSFNDLLLPLFKNWTDYYYTPNAITVLFQLQNDNTICLKQPLTSLGESLSFYEALRQNNLSNSSVLVSSYSQQHNQYDDYLYYLSLLSSEQFIDHKHYSEEYFFKSTNINQYQFSGILLEDISADISAERKLPLLFPKALIENLKQRPEVKQLYWAEELQIATPIIEYAFEASADKKEYFLFVQFSYLLAKDKPECKKPFVKFKLARFDYMTVHAMAALIFGFNYNFSLNLSRFLVMAMYGHYIASKGTYDLSRGHHLEEGKSLIFTNLNHFEGLYNILSKNPDSLFYYDSSYTPQLYSAKTSTEKVYDNFCLQTIEVTFLENTALYSKIREKTKQLTSLMHKNNLAACREQLKQTLHVVSELYHTIIHTFKLYTNMDYESLTVLLSQHLALPHPVLSQELFDSDYDIFQSIQQAYLKHNMLEGIINLHALMQEMPHPFFVKMKQQLQELNQPQPTTEYRSIDQLSFEEDNSMNACLSRLRQWLYVIRYSNDKNITHLHQLSSANHPVVHPAHKNESNKNNKDYYYHFSYEKLPYSIYNSSMDSFYSLQMFSQVVNYLRQQFTNSFEDKAVEVTTTVTVSGSHIASGSYLRAGKPNRYNTCAVGSLRFLNKENIEYALSTVLNTFQRVNPWQKTYIQPLTNGIRYYLLAFHFVTPQHLQINWLGSRNTSQKLIDALIKLFKDCYHDQRFLSLSTIHIEFSYCSMRQTKSNDFNDGPIILDALQNILIRCKDKGNFTGIEQHWILTKLQDGQYFDAIRQIRDLHKIYVYLNHQNDNLNKDILTIEKQFEDKLFTHASELKKAIIALPLNDLSAFLQQLEEQMNTENFWENYSEETIRHLLAPFTNEPTDPVDLIKNNVKSVDSNSNLFFSPKNFNKLSLHSPESTLVIREITGDGNCQFSAIAEQLKQINREEYSPENLRLKAVEALEEYREEYEPYYAGQGHGINFGTYKAYLERMKQTDEETRIFGDELTARALSKKLGLNILIFSPNSYGSIADSIKIRDNLWCTPIYHNNHDKTLNMAKTILLYFEGRLLNHYDTFSSIPDKNFIAFLKNKLRIIDEAEKDFFSIKK